jgi:hypothetical protein
MCDVTNVGDVLTAAKTVTVTYKGKTIPFTIRVVDKKATSISLETSPTKTEYIENQELDIAGATIKVQYNNGTTETIAVTKEMVSGYQKDKTGSQVITVTYSSQKS